MEIFIMINQMCSLQTERESSYYYSIIEDNKRISDDWNIVQNVFFVFVIITVILLWFEFSSDEETECSENNATCDTAAGPRLIESIPIKSEETASVNENAIKSETQIENTIPAIESTITIENVTQSENTSKTTVNSDENTPTTTMVDEPIKINPIKLVLPDSDAVCLSYPISAIQTRSILRNANMLCKQGECVQATAQKIKLSELTEEIEVPKPTKARRSLRFCDPEKNETPPLRRSLRLNPPHKESDPKDSTQINSSERLYCQEWCVRHRRPKRKRSKSRKRSSS